MPVYVQRPSVAAEDARLVVIEDFSDWPAYLVYMPLTALTGVGLVIGILGWARRHFTGDGRLHAWAKDRAFGVYLVHQACVVGVAVLVIPTTWPIAVKVSLTLAGATALTLALNEALLRIDLLAPAFGRDRRATTQPRAARRAGPGPAPASRR